MFLLKLINLLNQLLLVLELKFLCCMIFRCSSQKILPNKRININFLILINFKNLLLKMKVDFQKLQKFLNNQ